MAGAAIFLASRAGDYVVGPSIAVEALADRGTANRGTWPGRKSLSFQYVL